MTIQANQGFGVSVFGATGSGSGGTTSPGGSSLQIQYNAAGSFGGMAGTSWDNTNRSLTLTGATVTTSNPVLNLSQTWNAGAVTFKGWVLNVTDTASASASLLMDLQVGGSSKFSVKKDGTLTVSDGSASAPSIVFSGATNTGIYQAGGQIAFSVGGSLKGYFSASSNFVLSGINILDLTGTNSVVIRLGTSSDLILSRPAAATLQLGNADAAAPVAQTLGVQSVVAGTSNTAGANFTIKGSAGTGNAAGGSIIFQVAPAGGAGPSQNSFSTALTINSSQQLVLGGTNQVQIVMGNTAYPKIQTVGGTNFVFNDGSGDFFHLDGGSGGFVSVRSGWAYCWSSSSTASGGTYDLRLYRDAANTLALRNSTSAQTFRVYLTADGSPGSNYRRVAYYGEGIYLEALGTGLTGGGLSIYNRDNGPIYLATNNTLRWTISSSGNFLAQTDNNYDIGAAAANRPRTIYASGGVSHASPIIKTTDYSQGANDYSLIFNGAGSITLTLLAAASYPGKILYVKTIAAQTVVSASSNVKPIDTDTAGTAILAATAGKWAMLQSDGTNWVIMAQG